MIIRLLLMSFTVFTATLAERGLLSTKNMKYITISPKTPTQVDAIRLFYGKPGIKFLTTYLNEAIDMLVTAEAYTPFTKSLTHQNIKYKVNSQDVSKDIHQDLQHMSCKHRRVKRDIINFDDITSCPQFETIQNYLENLAQKYTDIVKLIRLGKTFEGRDITAVRIFSGKGKANSKNAMLIDAGIHAREWISPITAVYTVNELVTKPENHHLTENLVIYVICVLNPDGYAFTFTDESNEDIRFWRKTRTPTYDPKCPGVDANRNFGLFWKTTPPLNDPCDEAYSGAKPFSEPETQAFKKFVTNHPNIKSYVTLHSYGGVILYPWGYTEDSLKDKPKRLHRCVAKKVAKAISSCPTGLHTQYKIAPMIKMKAVTPLNGNSVDWMLGKVNVKFSFAVELPKLGHHFIVSPESIQPVCRETFEGFKVFAKHAETLYCDELD